VGFLKFPFLLVEILFLFGFDWICLYSCIFRLHYWFDVFVCEFWIMWRMPDWFWWDEVFWVAA
jgi:hypothetical protein